MNEELTGKRLKDVEDSIKRDLDLLKDFEDVKRLETDPRLIAKYQREIDRLQESLERRQQERKEMMNRIEDGRESVSEKIDRGLLVDMFLNLIELKKFVQTKREEENHLAEKKAKNAYNLKRYAEYL